jgi:hypothetical protein
MAPVYHAEDMQKSLAKDLDGPLKILLVNVSHEWDDPLPDSPYLDGKLCMTGENVPRIKAEYYEVPVWHSTEDRKKVNNYIIQRLGKRCESKICYYDLFASVGLNKRIMICGSESLPQTLYADGKMCATGKKPPSKNETSGYKIDEIKQQLGNRRGVASWGENCASKICYYHELRNKTYVCGLDPSKSSQSIQPMAILLLGVAAFSVLRMLPSIM